MNVQSRKLLLFLTVFCIVCSSMTNAFDYDTSSLREEITEISIHMFLKEGYYHLVIDNTGYVSGEYDREDSLVEIEIFAIDGEPEYVSDSRNLGAFVYWDIPISTEVFLFFTIHFIFNITATNPVTVFLTDEDGFMDFEEEIENFDFRKPSKTLLIIGIVIGIVFFAGITVGFIEKIRKKHGYVKLEKVVEVKEIEEETAKPGKAKTIFYFCEQCNEDYINKVKICPNCGNKVKKVKRVLEEVL